MKRYAWVIGIPALYVLACVLPAVKLVAEQEIAPGWMCLIPSFYDLFIPIWWTNPLFLLGCLLLALGFNRTAAGIGVLITPLAIYCAFIFWKDGGLGPGYFCWLASYSLLAVAGIVLHVQSRRHPATTEVPATPVEAAS